MQPEHNDALNHESLASREEMNAKFELKNKIRKITRIALIALSSLFGLFIILYFSLPFFQLGAIALNGNTRISNSDFAVIAELNSYSHLAFLNEAELEQKAIQNSRGLITSLDIKNNGFTCEGEIREERVAGIYQNQYYVSSGSPLAEFKADLKSLPLTQDRIDQIVSSYEIKEVPALHINPEVTFNSTIQTLSFRSMRGMNDEAFEKLKAYEYCGTIDSAHPEYYFNLVNLHMEFDQVSCYFEKTPVRDLKRIFGKSIDFLGSAIRDFVKHNQDFEKSALKFSDTSDEFEAYRMRILVNNDTGTISFTAVR